MRSRSLLVSSFFVGFFARCGCSCVDLGLLRSQSLCSGLTFVFQVDDSVVCFDRVGCGRLAIVARTFTTDADQSELCIISFFVVDSVCIYVVLTFISFLFQALQHVLILTRLVFVARLGQHHTRTSTTTTA